MTMPRYWVRQMLFMSWWLLITWRAACFGAYYFAPKDFNRSVYFVIS